MFVNLANAHSGRTDSIGGHNCYVGDCAGTYHLHSGSSVNDGSDFPFLIIIFIALIIYVIVRAGGWLDNFHNMLGGIGSPDYQRNEDKPKLSQKIEEDKLIRDPNHVDLETRKKLLQDYQNSPKNIYKKKSMVYRAYIWLKGFIIITFTISSILAIFVFVVRLVF